MIGGVGRFELLEPQYILPKVGTDGRTIVGYWYQWSATKQIFFPVNKLMHGIYRRSHRHRQLGMPPLGCLLTCIEGDMQADMYNMMVFNKGGLFGYAVLMDAPKNGRMPGQNNLARQVQEELRSNHAGARSGFDGVVLEGAKDIKQLNHLEALDGAFHKGSDKAAKQVAHVQGVPHERLGIVTNANEQYHAARLEDGSALQFDKSMNEALLPVDQFLNTVFLPAIGINDVKIQAKKRYNALTRTATQSLLDLGSLDGVMSIDEGRTEILKLPPFGGEEGKKPLRKLPNISVSSEIVPPINDVPIPMQDIINNQNEAGTSDSD